MPTYTLTAAQLNNRILNSFSIPAASTIPVNTIAPVISGTNLVGQTLTSSTGSWTGTPPITFGYQWKRNSINISNATASAYVTVQGDLSQSILCLVTATDSQGSASASSNSVTINQIPTNTIAPVISGTQRVGQTLSTTNGTWIGTPTITFGYQWKKNGSNIGGATTSTYLLTSGDLGGGTTIQCVVTGTNSIGNSNANSNILTGVGDALPVVSDSNAQAFVNAAIITDTTQANAINNLVIGLKADSLWTTLDAIYPFVGGTASQHKWNLKDPRDLDAAYRLQFNGGMTHSANGILFNGTNGWADTSGYNFSIDYFGCYTRNASDNGKDYMGSQGSELIDDGDGPYFVYINGFQLARDTFILSSRSGFGPTNNIISTGLSVVTKKTSSGQSTYFKNGIQRGSANNPVFTSVAFPPIAIGALNPNSDLSAGTVGIEGYSNQQIAFAFIGNSQLDATQNTNLYNRVQTFQTSLSRQV